MADSKKTGPKKAAKEESPESRATALREGLAKKRDELLAESRLEISKYVKGENRDVIDTALDDGDLSVIDLNETITLQMLGAHREMMIKIDESLRKLDEGSYGTCEDCGEEISTERLRVLPFAICCRDCQEIREEAEAIEKMENQG